MMRCTTVRLPRALTLILLAIFLVSLPLAANGPLEKVQPEAAGLSSERLARIDAVMEEHLGNDVMAGAMAMIARRGKLAYVSTWGDRDREQDLPMDVDTIFRIYSMSKPITGVALMALYEEGRFFLNDPIGKYLPELADLEVLSESTDPMTGETVTRRYKARRPITVRDLLRHTAGFSYGFFGNTQVDQMYREAGILMTDENIEETVEKLGQMPLLYEPGTRWHYSVAVDVQGRLIEVLSGQPFDQFLQERIFDPLGMVDTSFVVPAAKTKRFAQLYSPKGTAYGNTAFLSGNDSTEIEPADAQASRGYQEGSSLFSGGGGLVSTAMDYLRFSQMMLNGGGLDGVRILSPKTIELMTTDHLVGIDGGVFGRPGATFGLGFGVNQGPGLSGEIGSAGEYNWGGAAGTAFWIDPQEELIGVFMIQILPHRTTLGAEFKNLTYQAIID